MGHPPWNLSPGGFHQRHRREKGTQLSALYAPREGDYAQVSYARRIYRKQNSGYHLEIFYLGLLGSLTRPATPTRRHRAVFGNDELQRRPLTPQRRDEKVKVHIQTKQLSVLSVRSARPQNMRLPDMTTISHAPRGWLHTRAGLW